MARTSAFLAFAALLLPACGAAGGAPSDPGPGSGGEGSWVEGSWVEVSPAADSPAEGPEPIPSTAWTLTVSEEGSPRWIDPDPDPARARRDHFPRQIPGEVRVHAPETALWARIGGAFGGHTPRGAPILWFETPRRTVRIPTPPHDAKRPTVLTITLRADERGALVLDVVGGGEGWFGAYGCEEPFEGTWPWLGAPDRDLADWLSRAFLAAGSDPAALLLRVRAGSTGTPLPSVRPMLDVLEAVRDTGVASDVDLGFPLYGAPRRQDDAVEVSLRWQAAHQSEDGRWSGADWGASCEGLSQSVPRPGEGRADADVGTTGAALCTFLGSGYTNRGNHAFARSVTRALRWLRAGQGPDGRFARSPRDHAWATLAMVEAYGMTESPLLRASAAPALEAVVADLSSWDDDVFSLFLKALVLASARNVEADALARNRPAPWTLAPAVVGDLSERLSRLDVREGPLTEAVSLTGRLLLGMPAEHLAGKVAALPLPGTSSTSNHPTYLWLGTLANFRVGGMAWKSWNDEFLPGVPTQRRGPPCCYGGSWDPPPDVALPGGRVESSALYALALQIYYRYDKTPGAR